MMANSAFHIEYGDDAAMTAAPPVAANDNAPLKPRRWRYRPILHGLLWACLACGAMAATLITAFDSEGGWQQ